jgi:hypothetical protein
MNRRNRMMGSSLTGADQLVALDLHDHGQPFAASGSTTKCCATGTRSYASAGAGPFGGVERRDPARIAAVLGALDGETAFTLRGSR